jgi:hypothetical protein
MDKMVKAGRDADAKCNLVVKEEMTGVKAG